MLNAHSFNGWLRQPFQEVPLLSSPWRKEKGEKLLLNLPIFTPFSSTLFACANLALFYFANDRADYLERRISTSYYEKRDLDFNLFLINVVWVSIPNTLFNLCVAQFCDHPLSYWQTAAVVAVSVAARYYFKRKRPPKAPPCPLHRSIAPKLPIKSPKENLKPAPERLFIEYFCAELRLALMTKSPDEESILEVLDEMKKGKVERIRLESKDPSLLHQIQVTSLDLVGAMLSSGKLKKAHLVLLNDDVSLWSLPRDASMDELSSMETSLTLPMAPLFRKEISLTLCHSKHATQEFSSLINRWPALFSEVLLEKKIAAGSVDAFFILETRLGFRLALSLERERQRSSNGQWQIKESLLLDSKASKEMKKWLEKVKQKGGKEVEIDALFPDLMIDEG